MFILEVYPNCIFCHNSLSEVETKKNEEHQNFLHPLCNNCLSGIAKDVKKVFDKKKKKDKQNAYLKVGLCDGSIKIICESTCSIEYPAKEHAP